MNKLYLKVNLRIICHKISQVFFKRINKIYLERISHWLIILLFNHKNKINQLLKVSLNNLEKFYHLAAQNKKIYKRLNRIINNLSLVNRRRSKKFTVKIITTIIMIRNQVIVNQIARPRKSILIAMEMMTKIKEIKQMNRHINCNILKKCPHNSSKYKTKIPKTLTIY